MKKSDQIKNLLKQVNHPEINNSLVELGMIEEIQQDGKKVTIELKLPMANVPIKEMLVDLIKNKLKDFEVKINFSVMDEAERQKFFELAHKNWAL